MSEGDDAAAMLIPEESLLSPTGFISLLLAPCKFCFSLHSHYMNMDEAPPAKELQLPELLH